ncbi:hypothetical protein FHG87_016154 [Trinorchestia longiramus]|nr:hypothetical protein FHG87_016154 [Trinorchestia longiramus]
MKRCITSQTRPLFFQSASEPSALGVLDIATAVDNQKTLILRKAVAAAIEEEQRIQVNRASTKLFTTVLFICSRCSSNNSCSRRSSSSNNSCSRHSSSSNNSCSRHSSNNSCSRRSSSSNNSCSRHSSSSNNSCSRHSSSSNNSCSRHSSSSNNSCSRHSSSSNNSCSRHNTTTSLQMTCADVT